MGDSYFAPYPPFPIGLEKGEGKSKIQPENKIKQNIKHLNSPPTTKNIPLLYLPKLCKSPHITPPPPNPSSSTFILQHHHLLVSMRNLLQLLPSSSPSPSPAVPAVYYHVDLDPRTNFFFDLIPLTKSVFDIATFLFVATLLFISFISFAFVIHLRLKSRHMHHLQNFNHLWTVRLLLISFISLWGLTEILRLPSARRKYIAPFYHGLSLDQEANVCKFYVVLSLGFLEPGFLVTLLFLVNVSIKKRNPRRIWSLISALMTVCCPMLVLQYIFVYCDPLKIELPSFMHGSYVVGTDEFDNRAIICLYPFFSCIIFGVFAVTYVMGFLVSCWRVMAFVINKRIRYRINMLAMTVMVALPVQVLCLAMSWVWMPENAMYCSVVLVMFTFTTFCMAVAEFIMVIKPIMDALAAGKECQLSPNAVLGQPTMAAITDSERVPSL